MIYSDEAAYFAHIESFGFTRHDTLNQIILHVHNEDNLFFRIGTWGEEVQARNSAVGDGLICQQDLTTLGKVIVFRSKHNRIPEKATLQVISGRTFSEEGYGSPAAKGERFVYEPKLALEMDLPSLADIRDEYLDILKHGGILRKPDAPRVVSEDDLVAPYSEPKPPSLVSIFGKNKLRIMESRAASRQKFQQNWDNLVARREYQKKHGKIHAEFARNHPLSDNFKEWALDNIETIWLKVNIDEKIGVIYEKDSKLDDLNRELGRSNRHIYELRLFPVNYSPPKRLVVKEGHRNIQDLIKWADERIAKWNPRASRYSEPIIDEESGEYVEMPQLIGDYTNEHFAGVDENGDDTYRDFDADGVFLPMGNPNNSTDYQDDFDPDDLQSQSWQSLDNIDDHHYQEAYFKEVGVTETPLFDSKDENEIQWVNQPHENSLPPVERHSDIDFVTDAKNWLERGRLIQDAQTADAVAYILQRYPVSHGFSAYIEQQGVDWETTSEKLTEFLESAPNGNTPAVPVPVEVEECPFDDYDPREHELTAYDLFGDTLADRLSSGEYGFQLG